MKKVNLLVNSSPITNIIIKKIVAENKLENLIIVSIRCDKGVLNINNDLEFYSKDTDLVSGCSEISTIFHGIFEKFGKNIELEAYIGHGGWLLSELLYFLPFVNKINYIEEGLGTYIGVLDFLNKNKAISDYFRKTTYSKCEKKSCKTKIIIAVSQFIPLFSGMSKFLWKFGFLDTSILLFKIHRISIASSFFGEIDNRKTGVFYTTTQLSNLKRNCLVQLNIVHPIVKEKKILILLPPPAHINLKGCKKFFEKIEYIIALLKDVSFYYKSHPGDTEKKLSQSLNKYFGGKICQIDDKFVDNETAVWAHEMGYTGLICYQSAAFFYAIQIGRVNDQFLSLDLSQEVSNIESPSLFIAKKLSTITYCNTTESSNFFVNHYKAIYG